jgi:Ras GTPase-activating-like protein IQGAP2/3
MSHVDQPSSPGVSSPRRLTNRNTNRYSVTALFSMAAEQDVEVEDDLARGAFSFLITLEFTYSNFE